MKECLLCTRNMSKSDKILGTNCLKKAYNFLGISMPKTKKDEFLYKKIMKQNNKKNLNDKQKIMLLDRALTLNILNTVPIPQYNDKKEIIMNDINLIDKNTQKKDLNSLELVTLNQSLNIQKYYKKYEDIFQKIMNGNYDMLQDISFNVVKFAFSKYYNKKPYMSDMLQVLQYGMLQTEVIVLSGIKCDLSAKLLKHSLERDPKDIIINEEKFINKIKNDIVFKEKINEIVLKYGKSNIFDTGIDCEIIIFETRENDRDSLDLFGALHKCEIQVVGNKNNNLNWDLDIIINDRYDFTELQKIQKYVNGGLLGSAAAFSNNLASVATSCNVVHKYNITIKFSMRDWK